MNRYRQQLLAAVEAVALSDRTGYSWLGESANDLPKQISEAMTSGEARAYLRHQLMWRLYQDFYCRGGVPSVSEFGENAPTPRNSLTSQLSQANSGTGTCEAGWTVRGKDGIQVIVEKDGLALWAQSQELQASEELAEGVEVQLRLPKELARFQPGFYMALGNESLDTKRRDFVRLYWNLTPQGALSLVGLITRKLNRRSIPFRLKVVNSTSSFTRCDAGVLYLLKTDEEKMGSTLVEVYRSMAGGVKNGIPALTKRLAPGLALAEEPPDGTSFGMSRCGLIAEALIRAHEKGIFSVAGRLDAVLGRFDEEGVTSDRPYLNAGSDESYLSEALFT